MGPNDELSASEIAAFSALTKPGEESEESEGSDDLAGVIASSSGDSNEPEDDIEDGLRGMFKTETEADERLQELVQRVEEVDASELFDEIQSLAGLIKANSPKT